MKNNTINERILSLASYSFLFFQSQQEAKEELFIENNSKKKTSSD